MTEVDKTRNMVEIHFKGYSVKFDEWRSCDENNLPVISLEPMSQPTNDSLSDRLQAFCTGRSNDSCSQRTERIPKYALKIQVDEDVFNESLGRISSERYQRNNSYMKFFLMKLWIVILARSGMNGS